MMSQQLKSCTKTTNLETIKCQSYLNCLKENQRKCVCPRARSLSNSKPSMLLIPPSPPTTRTRSLHNSKQSPALPSPRPFSKTLLIKPPPAHRPPDEPLVEVTVQTQTNRKSRKTDTKRTPWSDILKSPVPSTFVGFDPLRTLHFLGNELNSVLAKMPSGDETVSKIVYEMMDALTRVPSQLPPERLKQTKASDATTKKRNSEEVPEAHSVKCRLLRVQHKVCQTAMDSGMFLQTQGIQKRLDDAMKNFDKQRQEMQELCERFKMEKTQAERQLATEKDTVRFLRNQMEDLQTERVAAESSTVTQAVKEKRQLQGQIKSLKQQTDAQASSIADLKNTTVDLQKQNDKLEQKNITLNHSLMISKLEKEKHLAILAVRDRQIKEIVNELNQLQEVVNEELLTFQKNPLLSQSSNSTVLGNWQQIQNEAKIHFRHDLDLSKTGAFIDQLCSKGNATFFDLQSFDSSVSNDCLTESQSKKTIEPEVPSKLSSDFQP